MAAGWSEGWSDFFGVKGIFFVGKLYGRAELIAWPGAFLNKDNCDGFF